jgi:hypothetical protein
MRHSPFLPHTQTKANCDADGSLATLGGAVGASRAKVGGGTVSLETRGVDLLVRACVCAARERGGDQNLQSVKF